MVLSDSADQERAAAVEREREYYDSGYWARAPALVARRLINRSIGAFSTYDELFDLFDPHDKTVLDYGCGRGWLTVRLAENGARTVTGIDVSAVQIEHARLRAAERDVQERVSFLVADANATPFPDDSFDLIVGVAILHHLDMERSLVEVKRLLRPGGEAIFMEPLWHNPLLRLGRALSPGARTRDEHPLTTDDWVLCSRVFEHFCHFERELVTTLLMPLNIVLPRRVQRAMSSGVLGLDARLLARFARLRKYARVTFLVFGRDHVSPLE